MKERGPHNIFFYSKLNVIEEITRKCFQRKVYKKTEMGNFVAAHYT